MSMLKAMASFRAAAFLLMLLPVLGSSVTLPNVLYNGTVVAESVSLAGNLDGQKLTPGANDTSFEWWYFDAVSASTNQSITVVFYESGPRGFINPYLGGPLSVGVYGSFANGSAFSYVLPATGGAVIKNGNAGISAEWKGANAGFRGTRLDKPNVEYVLTFDEPSVGLYGTVMLKSRAPAHYPCDLNIAGATEVILPHVFWSNAVPDALATVDMTIAGTPLHFTDGVGYHDKNWGDVQFATSTSSWYWGHARLGPYSVVWFDALSNTGVEYFSGYVAKHGKIIENSCAEKSVVVRPWGANNEYPPKLSTGVMQGFGMQFDLGGGKTLAVNVTTGLVTVDVGVYVRALGTVKGTVEGLEGCNEVYEGRTLFEEFKFTE